MIAYLKGKVVAQRVNYLILAVNGVGYKVFSASKKMLATGQEAELFTYNHVREEANDLYGFDSLDDLELFQKLISVNGVGPKAGLAIMATSSADRIASAIIQSDASFFTAVPGIGKKVAAKIILDLKSKIGNIKGDIDLSGINYSDDVADALIALGYKKEEIGQIISHIPADIATDEEKVRWCLKNLRK